MKIFITTCLVAVLGIGILGTGNSGSNGLAYAAHHEGNETKQMNATLAYAAHHEGNETKQMNATLPMSIIGYN